MPLDSKSSRILELYRQFQLGKVINKQKAAEQYGVNARSIQRDIEVIRDFLSEQVAQNGVMQNGVHGVGKQGHYINSHG
mgnify:CR=1 FL=1